MFPAGHLGHGVCRQGMLKRPIRGQRKARAGFPGARLVGGL